MRLATRLLPSLVGECLSLLLVLAGSLVLTMGWRAGRRRWPAVAFLAFMVPWPAPLQARLAFPLQQWASKCSADLLELLAVPVLREGNLIRLPGGTLHVAEACSGLRQLTAFLAIAACAAMLLRRPLWHRALVFASAVPIAVGVNVLRITATGLLVRLGYATGSDGVAHTLEGLVTVGVGIALLMGLISLLDRLRAPDSVPAHSQVTSDEPRRSASDARQPALATNLFRRARLVILLSLLVGGLVGEKAVAELLSHRRSTLALELRRPLAEFPYRIGAWVGADTEIDPRIIADIKVDEYLKRTYAHPSGERLTLWISYSRRSSDQYHYPTVCMRGTGWTEDQSRRARLTTSESTAGGEGITTPEPILRMFFERGQQRQMVHYWFYLIGEDPVDRWMRRLSRGARAFLRGRRNASVTVEIFDLAPAPNGTLRDDFARAVAASLEATMPEGTERASELGADF